MRRPTQRPLIRRTAGIFLCAALAVQLASAQAAGPAGAAESVKRLAASWEGAWNRHDVGALASLVAEDVDFVTVGGDWLKGRARFAEHHAERHRMQFAESVWSTRDVHVKLRGPRMAVAHVEWALKGDRDPDGTPRRPGRGIFTWLVERRAGRWLITTAQNTNLQQPAAAPCPAPMSRMLRTTLYFGLARPGGAVVGEAEWRSFVSEEVTPRFPAGLTSWEADGQWRRDDGTIIRERTRVMLLVHDAAAEARSKIDALIERYKKLFEQKSVMWEAAPVCVSF
ncbi:MAG TPA: SgcJ/EcaC family oxidoreductase [Pyrinomonadaceae bacterium]|jgi:uncharacterized protein (TIGR02246 family)|nr:SgcJ/EcaC family oxidoreductase [Pyrinomonadaceae bacterium]